MQHQVIRLGINSVFVEVIKLSIESSIIEALKSDSGWCYPRDSKLNLIIHNSRLYLCFNAFIDLFKVC